MCDQFQHSLPVGSDALHKAVKNTLQTSFLSMLLQYNPRHCSDLAVFQKANVITGCQQTIMCFDADRAVSVDLLLGGISACASTLASAMSATSRKCSGCVANSRMRSPTCKCLLAPACTPRLAYMHSLWLTCTFSFLMILWMIEC